MARTLLILAGGLGSRYGGLKQLDGMGPGGETLLEYALYDARAVGFEEFVMVVKPGIEAEVKEKILSRLPGDFPVVLVPQRPDDLPVGAPVPSVREKPLGTAHAVWVAREAVQGPFAVINADDFYGREGFAAVARFLDEAQPAGAHALVAWPLEKTLSPEGPVSRGVCRVDGEGFLERVEEHTGLARQADQTIAAKTPPASLPGKTPVSLNLFGFQRSIFDLLEDGLRRFLDAHGDKPRAECYLPAVVQDGIDQGAVQVRVLSSASHWMGVTHPGDRSAVVAALTELHEAGAYPTPLWSSRA